MKIKFICLFAVMLQAVVSMAQPRSESDAISVAHDFWGNNRNKLKAVSRTNIAKAKIKARITSDNVSTFAQPGYYVINDEANNRFVIVSGDERLYKILGYSDNGIFNAETAPYGLLEMLEEYDKQYQSVAPHLDEIGNANTRNTTIAIEPLIKTKWGQQEPFNNECPEDIITLDDYETLKIKSAAGCIATAMAQIMNYYKYPECGTGSNNYITSSRHFHQDMNFSAIHPDWNNMLDIYNDNASESPKAAVAHLLHACGVSVFMDYTALSSNADPYDMAYSLSHFWKYNHNLSYKMRQYYNDTEWNAIIQQELAEGHPILYGGRGADGGHRFILDGCDNNGRYNFNFGWNGNNDGFFSLDLLAPGKYNFSSQQSMVCYVTPETYGSATAEFYAKNGLNLTKANVGSLHIATYRIENYTAWTSYKFSNSPKFEGKLGVGIFDKDFNFIKSLKETEYSNYGYKYIKLNCNLSFDALTFKEGEQYYIAIYGYSEDTGYFIVRTEKGQADYYLATVKDGVITFEPMKQMNDTGTITNEVVTGLYNASSSATEGTLAWQIELWQDEQDKTKYWIANLDPTAKKNGFAYDKGWNKVYGYVSNAGKRIDIPVNQTIGTNLLLHNYTGGDNITLYLNTEAKTMSIEDVWGCVEQKYDSENTSTKDYSQYNGTRFAYTTVRDEDPDNTKVSPPLISVSDNHIMTLKSNTENTSIYYTLDDSQPSISSTLYNQPVELTENCTIKAIAIKGNTISSVATYTVSNFVCLEPIISQNEGCNTVTITSGTADSEIYYTLDETTPNRNAQRYTGNFDIEKSCIIKAIAVKQNYNDSPVASKSVIYHRTEESGELEIRIEDNIAGELANRVKEADKKSAQRWYISGKINGTDILYLKEVFELGQITDLDLSNTLVVSGGEAYYKNPSEYYTEDNVIGQYMFKDAKSLISLQLPKTITRIERFSLYGCDNLASIIIPELCTELEAFAIYNCKHMSSIHLGKSMELFDGYNGNGCPLLTSISVNPENIHFCSENGILFDKEMTTLIKYPCGKNEEAYAIPSSVKAISTQAFNSAALSNITMPEGLEIIGYGAFSGCKELLAANMPQSVNTIERSAFEKCTKLTKVSIPDKVKSVNSFCFSYCVNLRNVHLGNSIEKIDDYAFSNATSLQAFSVSDDNMNFTVNEGILYSKDKTSLIRCPLALYSDEMILDNDIESIESHAFANCTYIKSFKLPSRLKKIRRYAFQYCSMEGINIPTSVEIIEDDAFSHCKNLKSFIIPEALKETPSSMLDYCDNLEYVYIPANINKMGSYTFHNDKNLRTIECAITDISKVEVPLNYSGNEYTTFKNINKNCFWHVPAGCIETYTSQPWWVSTWRITDDCTTGIEQTVETDGVVVTAGEGSLTIQSDTSTTVAIYNIQGEMIREVKLSSNGQETIALPRGIYIVNRGKYHVR